MGKLITTGISFDLNVIVGFELFVYFSFYLFSERMMLCIIMLLLL